MSWLSSFLGGGDCRSNQTCFLDVLVVVVLAMDGGVNFDSFAFFFFFASKETLLGAPAEPTQWRLVGLNLGLIRAATDWIAMGRTPVRFGTNRNRDNPIPC